MKKIFFDCEFTGLRQGTELISIGCVTEDNETFYAEFNDYTLHPGIVPPEDNKFIEEHVLPNLTLNLKGDADHSFWWSCEETKTEVRGNVEEIKSYLNRWLQDVVPFLPEFPAFQMWSDCLAYNWVLFNHIWGGAIHIPKVVSYIPMDLCTMLELADIDPDISRLELSGLKDLTQHNALDGAKMIKACHEKLEPIFRVMEVNA